MKIESQAKSESKDKVELLDEELSELSELSDEELSELPDKELSELPNEELDTKSESKVKVELTQERHDPESGNRMKTTFNADSEQ